MSSDATFAPTVDEGARRRFEAAWRAGDPLPIERCLPVEDSPHFLATLEELAAIEMEFLWKAAPPTDGTPPVDAPPRVEAYLARFPRLNRPEIIRRLLRHELALRRRRGEQPSAEECRARFPGVAAEESEVEATLATGAAAPVRPSGLPGYEILEEIAVGGMGVVYKARQVKLNRLAAVKMILAGAHAGAAARARFQTEAEAAASLRHPNIVQIYEVGEHDGLPFLALEFMEGGSLAQKIAHAPQPPRAAAETAETLARAVHFAHQQGVIHRDLKPANVLLTADGVPKIADFGLAKRLGADTGQTRTGEVVGTPAYMAPEQAAPGAAPVGTPADVYALGAILYELLAGRPPFQAATALDVLTQVVSAEPTPPRRLRPKVPRDLETICLKCLRKEPRRRYGSAEALAEDLRRFLTGRPIQARRVGAVERAVKWVRRNAAASALAAVVLLAAAGGGAAWLWAAQDRAARQAEADRLAAARRSRVERVADAALRWAKEEEDQAAAVEGAADEAGREEPEEPETEKRVLDLLGQASKAVDEAERSLADAPDAEGAAARTAARRQAVAEATARAKRTAGLLEALERARDARAGTLGGAFDTGSAARDYKEALADYGLDVASRPEAESAGAIRGAPSGVRLALILALDDWAGCVRSRDRAAADRLGRIADLADDDKWRRAFRAAAGGDVVALKKLAEEAPGRRLPAATLDQLGRDLYNLGARPEATALLRAVRRQYPSDFWAYLDLTLCLQDPNKPDLKTLDEAEACGCAAVALRPRSSAAHHRLGCVLYVRQDLAGAVAHFQEAIRLDPLSARAVNDLAVALYAQEDLAGTEENIRRAIELDPKLAVLHKHLGVVLRDERKLEESADEFRRAVEMDPKPADAHYDLGVTLLYQGRFDAALLRLQRADLLAADLARDAPLRSTVQVELRECDRLLTLDDELDSVLTGARRPADDAERLGLAKVCMYRQRYAAAGAFYRDAFAGDPASADDLKAAHRYNAASCAARAGGGQGEDAGGLDEPARAAWRRQALDWLRADLVLRDKQQKEGDADARSEVGHKLRYWRADPALAGLRDAAELAKLPADEQEAWRKLWNDVQAILDKAAEKR